MSEGINWESTAANLKESAGITAACLAVIGLSMLLGEGSKWLFVLAIFAYIGLFLGVWRLVLNGLTAVSLSLKDTNRKAWQAIASLLVPSVFTVLLLREIDGLDWAAVNDSFLNVWFLAALAFFVYVGYFTASQLDENHPFRGFIIAALILFVLCHFWQNGMMSSGSEYDEASSFYFDPNQREEAKETGRYVYLYIFYTSAVYAGLLAGWRRRVK